MILFGYEWTPLTFGALGGALCLVFWGILAFMKKMKRLAMKTLFGGSTLLLVLFYWLSGSSQPVFLPLMPSAFLQVLKHSDFDLDMKKNQVEFKNDKGLSGAIRLIDKDTISFDTQTVVSAPDSVNKTIDLASSFTGSYGVQNEIHKIIQSKVNQSIALSDGVVELKGNMIHVHLEKRLVN